MSRPIINYIVEAATRLLTSRRIGGVLFDGSTDINLPGVNTIGNQDTTGNASSATRLATVRTVGGVNFDGTSNINLPGVNVPGTQSTSGNAATATRLQTARDINGTSFNGTSDILTALWGTARSIQIGDTAKSVNGGSDVTWTLEEIGVGSVGRINTTGIISQFLRADGSWVVVDPENTTYDAGAGLTLSNTTFSLPVAVEGSGSYVSKVEQTANGLRVSLGTPPNTNTTYLEIGEAEIEEGTSNTLRTITGRRLRYAFDRLGLKLGTTASTAKPGNWLPALTDLPMLPASQIATGTLAVDRLPNSGAAGGTYGSDVAIPVLAVDIKGRITEISQSAIRAASTSQTGVVQLSSSVTSASTTQAATASAVKRAYELAADALPASAVGVAGGVVPLNDQKLIDAEFLPSFVDDVLEAESFATLPVIGERGKIYITLDDEKQYRWSGSVYIWINEAAGTADVATQLATTRTIAMTGDGSWSVGFKGDSNVTGELTLSPSGVTAGTQGSGTRIPIVTVDIKGRITTLSSQAIPLATNTQVGLVQLHDGLGSASAAMALTAGQGKVLQDTKVDKVDGKGLSTNDLTDALLIKLGAIATGATKNATDVQLRNRETHTGKQTIDTVTGLQAKLDYASGLARGTTAENPNTTTHHTIVSDHVNTPGLGSLWYITTLFYGEISGTGNRTQTAVEYNPTNGIARSFVRTFFSTTGWTTWAPTGSSQITAGDIPEIPASKVTSGVFATARIPTLNQNTTGSAATLATARALKIGESSKTFDGSANVEWTLAEIGAVALTDPRLIDGRDWTATVVTQSEAEAGTANIARKWTALRDRQATEAWWLASNKQDQVDKGVTAHNWGNHADAGYVKTDTKYSAGLGLLLNGTQFSLPVDIEGTGSFVSNIEQTSTGLKITLGTPPNINTTYAEITEAEITAGTAATLRTITARRLNYAIDVHGLKLGSTATTAKPGDYTPSVSDVPNLPASKITSGTLASARIPTLNQDTTGSAATLTTARTLKIGNAAKSFNGSTNVEWTLAEIGAAASDDIRIDNGHVAFGWGNHSLAGYVKTDTTYTAGNGLSLAGTQFSLPVSVDGSGTYVAAVEQTDNGLKVTLGTPPNTNTTYAEISSAEVLAGTASTLRTVSGRRLKEAVDVHGLQLGTTASTAKAGDWLPASEDIPNLPASKIASGVLADARIPNLNASKITGGILASARLSGTYGDVSIKLTGGNSVFSGLVSGARTAYNLAEFRASGSSVEGAIVFIAPNADATIMYDMEIAGLLYNNSIVSMRVHGYRQGATANWSSLEKVNAGSIDVPVRWGLSPGGHACLILGDVNTSWSYPHLAIVRAMLSHSNANDDHCTGWSSDITTDLGAYTRITNYISASTMVTDVSGNAGTATRLATSRKIAGVDFDGTKDIDLPGVTGTGTQNTTGSAATLTTARTLKIGNSGKTFNGSANVTWTLSEIGAAAASHIHAIEEITGLSGALDNKVDITDSRLTNSREWTGVTISQAEVEAGTATTRRAFTSQRMRQGVVAWWNTITAEGIPTLPIAKIAQLQATLDTKVDKVSGYGLSQNNFSDSYMQKLDTLENSKHKGEYTSLEALETAYPTAEPGWSAHVDGGVGVDVAVYIWDDSDTKWVQSGRPTVITAAQVLELYEQNADRNPFTDALLIKLTAIATGATKNATDAQLRARASHTGEQAISTVTGLQAALDERARTNHTHTLSDITDAGTLAALSTNGSAANFLRGDGTWVTPTNTTYAAMSAAELTAGTASTARLISAKVLTDWLAAQTYAVADITGLTAALGAKASTSTQIIAGTGLTGGGTLGANRTLNVSYGTVAGTAVEGNDSRVVNAVTAFGWGDHKTEGYVKTDTKYTAGAGLTLTGTAFSLPVTVTGTGTHIADVVQTATGITITKSTPPNTNTTYAEITEAEINTGTAATLRTISARRLLHAISTHGLKLGTTATTAKAGNWSPAVADIPNLPASIITSGTLAAARIPTLNQDTTGNAATATKLTTARTVGGVSFDGSANINLPGVNTTGTQNTSGSAAKLTTARTLTIGEMGKTFDGSTNVVWTLAEIGAASVNDSRIINGQTAFSWGNHASAGYVTTNTTYAEITSAEVTAGTATTLRTITGRRLKEAVDAHGLQLGTTASTAKAGNWSPTVWDIPNLPASKITSGTLAAARIAALPISQITGLQAALDTKVTKTGDSMTGRYRINTTDDGLNDLQVGGDASLLGKTGFGNDDPDYTVDVEGDVRVRNEGSVKLGGTSSDDSAFSIQYNPATKSLDFNFLGA